MNVLLHVATAAVLALGAGKVDPEKSALTLTGARIIDIANGRILDGLDVLVVGDRIAKIGPRDELQPPSSIRRFDLTGLTLLPGLIDLHSHLLLHPYNETPWNEQVLKESLELRTIRAVVAARTTLDAGFTTVRDLGTEGAAYADVALRDAVAQGMVPGPRIFAVTRALVATGCYGPDGFDPRWDAPKGAQIADSGDGVRKAVREQVAAGADWIKVYADYRRRPGAEVRPTYSQQELNAVVDEARSAGLQVAAHATIDEAIRRCVIAGVATIEHGYQASEETLVLMRDHGVALCPTLAASEAMARYDGWTPAAPDHPRIANAKLMFARALRSGVTIANGSDVGVFPHGENARELELMVEYGMAPLDAIRAATATAAKVLDHEQDLGQVAEGYLADLLAVRGDPLKNIAVLRAPVLVVKNGVIVANRQEPGRNAD